MTAGRVKNVSVWELARNFGTKTYVKLRFHFQMFSTSDFSPKWPMKAYELRGQKGKCRINSKLREGLAGRQVRAPGLSEIKDLTAYLTRAYFFLQEIPQFSNLHTRQLRTREICGNIELRKWRDSFQRNSGSFCWVHSMEAESHIFFSVLSLNWF